MSTGAAIAATTEVLRLVLQNNLPDLSTPLGAMPSVSAVPPDRIPAGGDAEGSQVNVFMYKADLNPGWRTFGPANRLPSGERVTQLPMALDLHYLVSTYAKVDLHADVLLGYAMEILHGMPVLTVEAIEASFGGARPNDVPVGLWALLAASGLSEQKAQITLTRETQSIDEISKLWSVLGEKYRPSAAYVATTVLIQPRGPARSALPVTQPVDLQLHPTVPPRLTTITPSDAEWAAGTVVELLGTNLLGPSPEVLVGPHAAALLPGGRPDAVRATVPEDVGAGVHMVRIRHSVAFGSGTRGALQQSNSLALQLRPTVVQTVVVDPADGQPRRLLADLTPEVTREQAVDLLLNAIDDAGVGFTLPAAARTVTTGAVEFDVGDVLDGDYLVRVRVDGAASRLTVGPEPDRRFVGPTETFS